MEQNKVLRAERAMELKTLWGALLLALVLAASHAYLTAQLTGLVTRAVAQSQRPAAQPAVLPAAATLEPIDFEVQSAAEVEALNAGSGPRFESGN